MRATFLLAKDLQNEIKINFAEHKLENGDIKITPMPNVFIGHVPPKPSTSVSAENQKVENPKENSNPPFIIIRPLEGDVKTTDTSKIRNHVVKIGFLCCVETKESPEETEAGYNNILNMVDETLFTLNSKIYWENNHWIYNDDAHWVMGLQKELGSIYEAGKHEHPLYGAAVVATFTANALERPFQSL